MSLTDLQIKKLSKRMQIPLEGVYFKNELPKKLTYNKTYIVNLEDEKDEYGNENTGSHWVLLQINKYPNDKIEPIYFDPYGQGPPEYVKSVVKSTIGRDGLPFTTKDIQSLMNNACGYYCLALAHFINASQYRSGSIYDDVDVFMDMFDDLNHSVDFKKNEYILLHFFRSNDKDKRTPIDNLKSYDDIVDHDEKPDDRPDILKLPVSINKMV